VLNFVAKAESTPDVTEPGKVGSVICIALLHAKYVPGFSYLIRHNLVVFLSGYWKGQFTDDSNAVEMCRRACRVSIKEIQGCC